MTTPPPRHHRVLIAGLKFDAPGSTAQHFGPPAAIAKAVQDDLAVAERAGFSHTDLLFDPDRNLEEQVGQFEAYLRSGKFDAVMIGVGVRLVPEHTLLFERLVNLCRVIVPDIPWVFNTRPGTTTEALYRVFGKPGG
ncbi:Uu.00g027490.m01.CDS01 [Anthostomella pinea]|uniref:Uu.00g027490.m01.CDS01 n=1 Tax=Anthostomella pinea TaxID=933095 RepID=A0AAI8V7Q5_9PEZI|nr:Uu.00g027490.m01.CDS01 [Anthostomella pinea]